MYSPLECYILFMTTDLLHKPSYQKKTYENKKCIQLFISCSGTEPAVTTSPSHLSNAYLILGVII